MVRSSTSDEEVDDGKVDYEGSSLNLFKVGEFDDVTLNILDHVEMCNLYYSVYVTKFYSNNPSLNTLDT